MEELLKIQQELNAPKDQYNNFGKYNYRSCEGILAAVKPLLKETGCTLTLSDEIVPVSNRVYVTATATLTTPDGKQYVSTASAREDDTKKGMDGAQITGAASSYARKYALNGLFCIDDVKDPDATNDHGVGEQQAKSNGAKAQPTQKDGASGVAYTGEQLKAALAELDSITTEDQFGQLWQKWANTCPALCMANTEFYKKACLKINQIRNSNTAK